MFALHLAAHQDVFNEEMFRLLLKYGADLSLTLDKDGSTIFHYAVDCENGEKILEIILETRNDGSKCNLLVVLKLFFSQI